MLPAILGLHVHGGLMRHSFDASGDFEGFMAAL
jgi:hypothetical protein